MTPPSCITTENNDTSLKNEQGFDKLLNRKTNVYPLPVDDSLGNEFTQSSPNRFVITSFSGITHLIIPNNRAYTHNFKEFVTLISGCVGKQLKNI